MKYHPLENLQNVADIEPSYPHRAMSRNERLQRWAELLEKNADRCLSTLRQTEYLSTRERAAMRSDGSPISVAFADPVLRAAGLEDDTYGEAQRFFELTDNQLHKVICYCQFGSIVSGATAAYHLRKLIARQRVFALLRRMFGK